MERKAALSARSIERGALEAALVAFIVNNAKKWAVEAAKKWALSKCKATGELVGRYDAEQIGFESKRFLGVTYRKVPVFSVRLDMADPFRYFDRETGLEFRTDPVVRTDWGSIPWTAQKLSNKYLRLFPEQFKGPYLMHDGGYGLGGLWCRKDGSRWAAVQMTRAQIDAVLWATLAADGAMRGERLAILAGVRMGGWAPWATYRRREESWLVTGRVRADVPQGDIRRFEGGLPPGWLEAGIPGERQRSVKQGRQAVPSKPKGA
jgi:hypothetical protein